MNVAWCKSSMVHLNGCCRPAKAKQSTSCSSNGAVSANSTSAWPPDYPARSQARWRCVISTGRESLCTVALHRLRIWSDISSFFPDLIGPSPRCSVQVALLHQPLKLVWRDMSQRLTVAILLNRCTVKQPGSSFHLGDRCMHTCPSQLDSLRLF